MNHPNRQKDYYSLTKLLFLLRTIICSNAQILFLVGKGQIFLHQMERLYLPTPSYFNPLNIDLVKMHLEIQELGRFWVNSNKAYIPVMLQVTRA